MKRHIITLAVSCVMLNSCGIYTKYKPASEVSADLYGSEATAQTDTVSLGDMSWREVFTDPQLQTLIEHGLANNTDYRSAQLRVEEAEAALLSAKLAFLPAFAFAPQGAVSSFVGNWIYLVKCAMPKSRRKLFTHKVKIIGKRYVHS